MPQTFSVDSNNDLFIGNDGNLAISFNLEAVVAACASAAKAQRGEMIFATDKGIPNFQTVWNGSPNIPQFEAALRRTLLSVLGVTEILSVNTVVNDNVLSYTARIKTIYGEGVVNG